MAQVLRHDSSRYGIVSQFNRKTSMKFEALGRYTHLKETRQNELRRLSFFNHALVTTARNLGRYQQGIATDNIAEDVALAELAIADIKALVQRASEQWDAMQQLKVEYNLPD